MESDFIKCESPHHKDKILAVRYCSRCVQLICTECVVDLHSNHFEHAKLKIDDILSNEKLVYEKMFVKASDIEKSRRVDSAKISKYMDKLEQTYHSNVKEVELVIENLHKIIDDEKALYKTVKSLLDKQTDKCANSTKYKSILVKKNILAMTLNEWEYKSKLKKMELFKERSVMEVSVNLAADELLKEPNFIDEFDIVLDLYSKKKHSEEINKILKSSSEIKSKIESYREIIGNNEDIQIIIEKIKPKDSRVTNNSNVSPLPSLPIEKSNYKYLINYQWIFKKVGILDLEVDSNRLNFIYVDKSCCCNNDNIFNSLSKLKETSTYVNFGDSILICAGSVNNYTMSECYYLQVYKLYSIYKVNVKEYGKMSQSRKYHSIIYLEDIKSVLACGGNTTKSSEITNLTQGTWTNLTPMNECRSVNSTLLYFNNTTVFCFGGIVKDVFSDTCECIDIKTPYAIWKYISIEKETNLKIKFNSMGVIKLNTSKFLLLGGVKVNASLARTYNKTGIEVLIGNGNNWKVSENTNILENISFNYSSNFVKWKDEFLNIDTDSKILKYNPVNKNGLMVSNILF